MARRPKVIMTSRDVDRLETLLESLPPGAFAGKAALEAELERAEIVEPADVPPDVVTMNSTVRFRIEESGEEFRMTLVHPEDVQGRDDRISVLAPVGSALLGLSVGAKLEWPRPGRGVSTVKVVEVADQPEMREKRSEERARSD